MDRDVQFAVLEILRSAGVRGENRLYVCRSDAQRVLDGLEVINAALDVAESINTYEGTADD
jgi:hypothetical protein